MATPKKHPYRRLNLAERRYIQLASGRGDSLRRIAFMLRRSPSTVSRELGRNHMAGDYNAETAHKLSEARQRVSALGARPGRREGFYFTRICVPHMDRSLVAWYSDTQTYHRNRFGTPDWLRLLQVRKRSPFRTPRDSKPYHYLQLKELIQLLRRQAKVNKEFREQVPQKRRPEPEKQPVQKQISVTFLTETLSSVA
ncbi:hypothetical protein FUAX_06460 [Fulvitalea axinellae]|uniref:Transposase IS30-like HTH domain-containing protein n=1 Tax=Fulvitalea axinellae TaxID=1182444 RepID=A0AAU9CPD1_9BACT|nr:hypothetical protein FUAX_06460 [Fulvitalea axinellae]